MDDEEMPGQTSELVVTLTVADQKRALRWLVENGQQGGIYGVDDDFAIEDDEENN